MRRREKTQETGDTEDEIIPTRWQHLSHQEQYSYFKEEYSQKIEQIMRKNEKIV